jgi:hypothetical protein
MPKPPTPSKPTPKRRRVWFKRCTIAIVLLALLLVAGVLVVGRTPILTAIVTPIIEKETGLDVVSGRIVLGPSGDLEIHDAVLRAPSIPGPAGQLLSLDRADIAIAWPRILSGAGAIERVRIDRPLLRVSQDMDTRVVNLAALNLRDSGSGAASTPQLIITRGIVEIGEHDESDYHELKRLSIVGQLDAPGSDGTAPFSFGASDAVESLSSATDTISNEFEISGQIHPAGVRAQMTGLTLEDWPPSIVPSSIRDVYTSLDLTGQLAPTTIDLGTKGRVSVTLTLEGVDLTLPFDPPGAKPGDVEHLRMRGTRGTITFGSAQLLADLTGRIDKLDYKVALTYMGYSPSAALECTLRTSFRYDDTFRPRLFLPEAALDPLNRFTGLSADVDAVVQFDRAAPQGDTPAPLEVSGRASISNGRARYEEFAYPFQNITGNVRFNPSSAAFDNLTGTGPTGAKLNASGTVDGFGDDSRIHLTIAVDDLPIDTHLLSAMDDDQRALVRTLFSRQQYTNLLESGFVSTPDLRAPLLTERRALYDELAARESEEPTPELLDKRARLRTLDRALSAPDFTFGGAVSVVVDVKRDPARPKGSRWPVEITANIPQAGLVPEQFPLPIIAKGVTISIIDNKVELKGGSYAGLSGGSASVDATIRERNGKTLPYVEIKARDIPIDDRLIAAIPGYYAPQPADPTETTLRRILDRLQLRGLVECDAVIGPRSDDSIGYEVQAGILTGSAAPIDSVMGPTPDTINLSDLRGTIFVTESLIVVDIAGALGAMGEQGNSPVRLLTQLTLPQTPRFGTVDRTDGLLPFEFGPPTPGPALYTRVTATNVDLTLPLEDAIGIVSPDQARTLSAWRDTYDIDGAVTLRTVLDGRVGGTLSTILRIDKIQRLGFTLEDQRYDLGQSWGRLALDLGTNPKIDADGFRVPILVEDDESGQIALDGVLPLARGGALLELENEPPIRLELRGARLGSAGVKAAARALSADAVGNFIDDYSVKGRADALIDLRPIDTTEIVDAPTGALRIPPVTLDGSLTPRSLTLTRNNHTLDLPTIEGQITFDGLTGRAESIHAVGAQHELFVDGLFSVDLERGATIDMSIGARGDVLADPMKAVLPQALIDTVDQLDLHAPGGVELGDLHIAATNLGRADARYDITGNASVRGADLSVGIPITELDTNLAFDVSADEDSGLQYTLDLEADRLRAGLLRVHNARATIVSEPGQPRNLVVPDLRAGMHGGMVTGTAQVRVDQSDTPRFSTELQCSGVRAAPIFDDLFLPPQGLEGPPRPGFAAVRSAWNVDDDLSRGALTADLALQGIVGQTDGREGRGYVRVAGGSIVALPGLINLIEASNLTLPTGSKLNLAEAEFYIDDDKMAFERISASSDAIEILGFGTMDWTSRAIDLRFRSRSIEPIPVLSSLLEGIRDELITTRVTGAPGSIDYNAEQFGTTKRLIRAMLGEKETEQQRRLREVETRTRVGSGYYRTQSQDETLIEPTIEPAGNQQAGIEPTDE